nr:hypothetical protein [Providencia rettgeri]
MISSPSFTRISSGPWFVRDLLQRADGWWSASTPTSRPFSQLDILKCVFFDVFFD